MEENFISNANSLLNINPLCKWLDWKYLLSPVHIADKEGHSSFALSVSVLQINRFWIFNAGIFNDYSSIVFNKAKSVK